MPACGSESASVGSFLVQSWASVYGIINSDIVKGFKFQFCLLDGVYMKTENSMWMKKITYCENEYRSHGLPCIFKITDADRELADELLKRG